MLNAMTYQVNSFGANCLKMYSLNDQPNKTTVLEILKFLEIALCFQKSEESI